MSFRFVCYRISCCFSRIAALVVALLVSTACVGQKAAPPQPNQPLQARTSHAVMAPPAGSNSALPVTKPKTECEPKPPSACVEPPQPEDPEHERWTHETEERFKQFLPKLKDCGRELDADRDSRVIVTLDFAESGVPTGEHVYRATTGNCEAVACLKRAVHGFKAPPHKSAHWRYSAYLSRNSRKGTGWLLDPTEEWDKFIAKGDANHNCVEELPVRTGRLPPVAIQKTIREHYDMLRKCYEDGLGRDRNLCGRVQVRFVIDEDGNVPSVQVDEGTNLTDCEAVQCMKKHYLEMKFPKPDGGIVTVVYPIMFQPK